MNFRRRQSKEMRSNSAKWNNNGKGNYDTTNLNKSPPGSQFKRLEQSFDRRDQENFAGDIFNVASPDKNMNP